MMNTKEMTNTTKAMVETNNLFKDYEIIESILNSVKNIIKTAMDNKYSFDKIFMLTVVRYQQKDNGFNKVFVKDLETIVSIFKESVQYVSKTEDLYFQEEYCLLDFNKFSDIKKFAVKYAHEYYHDNYDDICKIFDRIEINDELINVIKEMRNRNLISEKDKDNINILTTRYNNRNRNR